MLAHEAELRLQLHVQAFLFQAHAQPGAGGAAAASFGGLYVSRMTVQALGNNLAACLEHGDTGLFFRQQVRLLLDDLTAGAKTQAEAKVRLSELLLQVHPDHAATQPRAHDRGRTNRVELFQLVHALRKAVQDPVSGPALYPSTQATRSFPQRVLAVLQAIGVSLTFLFFRVVAAQKRALR